MRRSELLLKKCAVHVTPRASKIFTKRSLSSRSVPIKELDVIKHKTRVPAIEP
jgi:hypothetical protein